MQNRPPPSLTKPPQAAMIGAMNTGFSGIMPYQHRSVQVPLKPQQQTASAPKPKRR